MICVEQHNTKACVICTGVVWPALPVVIALSALCTKWKLTIRSIYDMYKKHIKLTQREKLTECRLFQYVPEDT